MFFLFFISCKNKNVNIIDHLQIEFDGFAGDYHKKYDLLLDIKSPNAVTNMLKLFKESKDVPFCRLKPVMWQINVYRGPKSNRDLLFYINSNTEDEVYVAQGFVCYDNPLLIQTLARIVKLDKIREYKGPLDQEAFIKMIVGEDIYDEVRME